MDNNPIYNLLDALEHARDAEEILERIYIEYGPYGHGEISQETRFKINNFFGFDDSE